MNTRRFVLMMLRVAHRHVFTAAFLHASQWDKEAGKAMDTMLAFDAPPHEASPSCDGLCRQRDIVRRLHNRWHARNNHGCARGDNKVSETMPVFACRDSRGRARSHHLPAEQRAINGKERAQGSRCQRVQLVFADEAREHELGRRPRRNMTRQKRHLEALANWLSHRMLFPAPPFFRVNWSAREHNGAEPASGNTSPLAYHPSRCISMCPCMRLFVRPSMNSPASQAICGTCAPLGKTTSSNDLAVAHSPRPIEPGSWETARQVPAGNWSKHLPSCPKGHLVWPRRPREFQADIPSCRDAGRGSTPSEHDKKKKGYRSSGLRLCI